MLFNNYLFSTMLYYLLLLFDSIDKYDIIMSRKTEFLVLLKEVCICYSEKNLKLRNLKVKPSVRSKKTRKNRKMLIKRKLKKKNLRFYKSTDFSPNVRKSIKQIRDVIYRKFSRCDPDFLALSHEYQNLRNLLFERTLFFRAIKSKQIKENRRLGLDECYNKRLELRKINRQVKMLSRIHSSDILPLLKNKKKKIRHSLTNRYKNMYNILKYQNTLSNFKRFLLHREFFNNIKTYRVSVMREDVNEKLKHYKYCNANNPLEEIRRIDRIVDDIGKKDIEKIRNDIQPYSRPLRKTFFRDDF